MGYTYSDAEIRDILQSAKTIAIVGASPKEVRPSFFVARYMLDKGYRVFPVNPGQAGKSILGQMVYAALSEIPEPIDIVDVFRSSAEVPRVVDAALKLHPLPKVIWMQLGISDDAAAARAGAAGVKVIMDRCLKIEYGRLSGEIGWAGVNSRVLSSRKPVLAVLAGAITIFIAAASLSRYYVSDGRLAIIVVSMALYIVGNLMMVRVMREIGLGPAISVAIFAQLILVNLVAFTIFQERPAPLQLAGIALGAVSMLLILMPAGKG